MLPPKLNISYSDIIKPYTDLTDITAINKISKAMEDEWVDTYYEMISHTPTILNIQINNFTFLYDQTSATDNSVADRLIAAYGWSSKNAQTKDTSRMKGFLGGGIDIPGKGKFDKGHVLAHSMGGGLDINLFPQKPELNRGISEAGKTYRRMEKYASENEGTFVFSRPIYEDDSWVPASLEYGIIMKDGKLWTEWFEN